MAASLEDIMKSMADANYGPGKGDPETFRQDAVNFLAGWTAMSAPADQAIEEPAPAAKGKKAKAADAVADDPVDA